MRHFVWADLRALVNIHYVILCVGRTKATVGQCMRYCPATRATPRCCPGKEARSRYHLGRQLLVILWSILICRLLQQNLPILYTVNPVTFICGISISSFYSNNHSECYYINCYRYVWTGAHCRCVSQSTFEKYPTLVHVAIACNF